MRADDPYPWNDPLHYCPECGAEVDEPGLCDDCIWDEVPEIPSEYD